MLLRSCAEAKLDKCLAVWHGLADEGLKGFKWKDDLMFLSVIDPTFQAVEALVLPKEFRVALPMVVLGTWGIIRCFRGYKRDLCGL